MTVDNSNTDNTNAVLGLSKLEIAGVNFSEGFDPVNTFIHFKT